MTPMPYLTSSNCAKAATDLMTTFGINAGQEASSRAHQSRDVGNIVLFCRWRQIERLILVLENGQSAATLH